MSTRRTGKAKVLLGQAYSLRLDPKLRQAMQPYPPLATLYAASVLRAHGWEVALFDATLAESSFAWSEALERNLPEVVVLYEDSFNYLSKMCLSRIREEALSMIAAARRTAGVVIVASSDASDCPDLYLEGGADYVLVGEAEESLVELLARLEAGKLGEGDTIAGVVGRRGQPVVRRPPISDLDSLPLPAWDLVDVDRYRHAWRARHGLFSLNMVTTRGCPYHCNWCAKPIWGQRYHSRSPENVVLEMQRLAERYAPDHLWFMDDIFGLRPGWIGELADRLESCGLRLPFKCLSRPDLLLRAGEVDALARAGCENVWMGAESGSQRILDAMEKGTTVEQIRQASTRLRAAGIQVGLFLQFGYPGETREDIERTFSLVREVLPNDIGVSVSYPLPGTKFHERVREELLEKDHWVDSADLDMMYQGPFVSDFYRQLHRVLHLEFRARRSAATLLASLRSPRRLRPRHLGAAARAAVSLLRLPVERRRLDHLGLAAPRPTRIPGPELSAAEASRPTPQPIEQR